MTRQALDHSAPDNDNETNPDDNEANRADGMAATGPSGSGQYWAVTTLDGIVIEASEAMGRLLHMSSRSLPGRDLYLFLVEHREKVRRAVAASTDTFPAECEVRLRPRDRRALTGRLVIARGPKLTLEWHWYGEAAPLE